MGKLVIKFPTRNRPEKFKAVFSRYLTYLSGRHEARFVISMDEDDPTMNNDGIREWLATRGRNVDIAYYYGSSKTKIEACNANMEGETGDVLMLASDDMNPVHMGYDEVIFEVFEQCFPDFRGGVKFWDGRRPKEDPLMTLAVVGFPLYRQIGYIYHPDYRSVYCDDELTHVCQLLGVFAISTLCIVQHEWTPHLFDELHERNEDRALYNMDREVFRLRESRNFDLEAIMSDSHICASTVEGCGRRRL